MNGKPKNSILVAVKDSISSRAMIDYLCTMYLKREAFYIRLIRFFRQPSASRELMGEKFTEAGPKRAQAHLEQAKKKLVEHGFISDRIAIEVITEPYPTVGDGIIDQYQKGDYDMVMIGRKKMSKAEEFVKGDISIKLIRSLPGSAILVVTSR